MKTKEFYQFFLKHENLSDDELVEKVIAKFNLLHNKAVVKDLIQFTRMAKSLN